MKDATLLPRVSSISHAAPILFIALLFSLLGGVVLAVLPYQFGILILASLVGLAIAARKDLLLYFTISVALLASGLAQLYYPPLSFIRWMIPVTASLLLVHLILSKFGNRGPVKSLPWILRWALLFFIVAIFSSFLNWRGGFEFLQGTKLYFQLWGMLFGLALLKWRPGLLDGILKAIFVLAVIQLPFALHQFLFIAPEREGLWHLGVVPLDVVSGSMGANRFGSGKNSVLGIFLISSLAVLTSQWREKGIKLWFLLAAAPFLLAPLFLNESKFSLVLLLTTFGYIFRKEVIQHPARFIIISILTVLMATGLLTSYSMSFGKGRSIAETVEYSFESNFGARGYAGMVLNRWTALSFWAEQHGLKDIPGTLIGHGLGASHESSESVLASLSKSIADTRYPNYGIGLTGITSLLWDTGLLGVAAIFAMFASAFLCARRLSIDIKDPWHRGVFEGLQAAIIAAGLMLFHSNYFVIDPSFQCLIYFVIGYICYWSANSGGDCISNK